MKQTDKFSWITDGMLEDAHHAYQGTKAYKLMREKLAKMEEDCKCMLSEDEQGFVRECFALKNSVYVQQEQYLYYRGMKDGIQLLKWLGVIV